jgi:hypothetical protein
VQFLASVEATTAWRRREPRALILTLAEGFALGRAVNRLRLGAALAEDSPPSAGARTD